MLYANDQDGSRVLATPQAKATCPACSSPMIAKCGRTVVWHWAHEAKDDCDSWSEGETIWHAAWKSRFQNSEVTISRGGVLHRADAVTPSGVVVEFQHSAISSYDIELREQFYGNMIWVLDATVPFRTSRIALCHEFPKSGSQFCRFRWLHRKTSFDLATSQIFLDLGVCFRDTSAPFYKSSDWWDDGDGGLKDGVRRREGFWARTEVAPMLLEIKKRTDGCGWGRVVTHREFCRRFGAAAVPARDVVRGLRWHAEAYSGFDGFAVRKSVYGFMKPGVWDGGDYGWCAEELKKE